MDQRLFYSRAAAEAGAGDAVLATCIEGRYKAGKALFRAGGLLAYMPAGSEDFWRQLHLPEEDGFCGLIPAPGGGEVFCDPLMPEPKLIIVGAGHVSRALAAMARDCGFTVFVVDERPELLTAERFPGCTLLNEYASGLELFSGVNCYFAVMAGDHQTSEKCLTAVMSRSFAYAGLIGAARRREGVIRRLQEAGIAKEKADGLVMPIGLDIGAETPQEVAVSILAQLIARRREVTRGAACYIPIYEELCGKAESRVLATVIRTEGSAPRAAGSKLIYRPDGSFSGSVGGGSLEEDVLTVAALTMEDGAPRRVLTRSEAGGRVEVFVELI